MRLFLFECKKLLSLKNIVFILAALVLQAVFCFIPFSTEHDYSPEIYIGYIEQFGGKFTEEKYSEIQGIFDEFNKIISEHDGIVADYQAERISLEEFTEHNFAYGSALTKMETVGYLLRKSDYFKQIGGECEYFYDTDWEDFLKNTGFNFIAAFTVIFLTISIFCGEYQSNSRAMIFTSLNGQGELCAGKLIVGAVAAFLAVLALFSVRYAAFDFNHQGSRFAIRNLIGYSEFGNISIKQYYFRDALIKSSLWAVGALFVCAVSNITRNMIFTAFLSFVSIVCTAMFSALSAGIWKYLFLGGLLSRNYPPDLNIAVLSAVLAAKSGAYCAASVRLWRIRR